MKSGKRKKIYFFSVLILLMPVMGYLISRGVIYAMPMNNNAAIIAGGLITAMLLLGIPYLMLKTLFHNAHLETGERELKIRDLPDNQQQHFIEKPENPAGDPPLTGSYTTPPKN
jgi:hypothetical protein